MQNYIKRRSGKFSLAVLIILVSIIIGPRVFKTIQPNERGVIFRPLTNGLDKEHIIKPGFKVIAPWNSLQIYNVKEQQIQDTVHVLDKDGLGIFMVISVRFNLIPEKIGFMHEIWGLGYLKHFIKPVIRSSGINVAKQYSAHEIYLTKRKEVEDGIIKETKSEFEKNNVEMRVLLIKAIILPAELQAVYDAKLKPKESKK